MFQDNLFRGMCHANAKTTSNLRKIKPVPSDKLLMKGQHLQEFKCFKKYILTK